MNVALVGSGLIGGSIGLALKERIPSTRVIALDRDPAVARRAVERGAADEAAGTPAELAGADIVFVATPVGAIAGVVLELAEHLRPGSIVTDVGSTKSRVVVEVEAGLPQGISFVGGHPMAGTEDEGIDAATEGLFAGAWWILTPTDRSDSAAYERLHGLLTTLGARVMALSPERHDELMAIVSHLPHLTATALMNMTAERGEEHAGLLALAAGGFRDVTRVAASNPEIWLDICRENAAAIGSVLEGFAERLLGLRDLVERADGTALRAEFLRARDARRSLPGKPVEGELFEIKMPVPDRPGVLASVTTSVGNLGVNIEDLEISHASEGGRGTLRLLLVGEESAGKVEEALTAQGFEPKATRL